tara:strand:- start:139 stop:402 length:264 start_codon:yes stop_codon:yes gene_type:complete
MAKNKKTQHQQQEDFNRSADSFFRGAGWLLFIGLCLFGWISIGTSFFGWVGDKMDDRDLKKERCINETYNIKNEFTAKKKYKACMKR